MRLALVISFGALAAACASTPPSHHPSAAGYDQLAAAEDRAAADHLSAADVTPRETCGSGHTDDYATCWTPPNTEAHRAAAREHRRVAATDRARSSALRTAEARACTGVSEIDRDVSPFAHSEDILRVTPLRTGDRVDGARVVFRRVPQLDAAKLQHIVDCHLARNDAMGHDVPHMSYCPLVPPNVAAKVTDVPDGFQVDVTSDDRDAAREVLTRANALVGR